MIKQEFQHGKNLIVIETAETVQDIENNSLQQGQYHRFFINGKQCSNYMDIMNHIIEENRKESSSVVPSNDSIKDLREKMLSNNIKELTKTIDSLKDQYEKIGVSKKALEKINDYSLKINGLGVRVKA